MMEACMQPRPARIAALATLAATLAGAFPARLSAHHSFAMYDGQKTYVFTGVVTRVSPDPSHLTIFFSPLNENRDAVIRDASGKPVIWSVELRSASQVALEGVTSRSFPPGTIFSIGLHPLRSGLSGGGRGNSGLFKCPANTPPAPGKHCDSVTGSTSHGESGKLPAPTGQWLP
jgi:Family of unknown function (DUF6152)